MRTSPLPILIILGISSAYAADHEAILHVNTTTVNIEVPLENTDIVPLQVNKGLEEMIRTCLKKETGTVYDLPLFGTAKSIGVYFDDNNNGHPEREEILAETMCGYIVFQEGIRKEAEKGKTEIISNKSYSHPKFQYFYSSPKDKAGITAEIRGLVEGNDADILNSAIYEDGKKISSKAGEYISVQVSHNESGTHTYQAEAIDSRMNHIISETIQIQFMGREVDLSPEIPIFFSSPADKAGITAEIHAIAHDEGDNAGITKIILYEDGKEISSGEKDNISVEVKHNERGTHTYHAEAIDKGGHRGSSKTVSVAFSGEYTDFPPTIPFLNLFPKNNAGISAKIYATAHDEGDNAGITKITLYEDGREISSEEGNNISAEVMHNESGTHTYQAEVIDKGGHIVKSEITSVVFSGK